MRFSAVRFNNVFGASTATGAPGALGQNFAWRKSYQCPCFNPVSGAALSTCPLCFGHARIWDPEILGAAGMTAQAPKKMFDQFGAWEPGDAVLTIPSNSALYGIGWLDRIRCLDSTTPFSTFFTRGEGDIFLISIVSINRVFWLADDQETIIDGTIPTIGADGSINWSVGDGPSQGTQYSISGVKWDEYFAWQQQPSDRNIGVDGLPLKLPLRVFDLFRR